MQDRTQEVSAYCHCVSSSSAQLTETSAPQFVACYTTYALVLNVPSDIDWSAGEADCVLQPQGVVGGMNQNLIYPISFLLPGRSSDVPIKLYQCRTF
jgi:hypothetical protein